MGTNVNQGDFKSTLHGKSWKINDKHLDQHMSIPANGIDSNFSIFMLFSYQVSQVMLKYQNGSVIPWLQQQFVTEINATFSLGQVTLLSLYITKRKKLAH